MSRAVSGQLLKHPVHFLALGFGSGLLPKAPGTFGTLAAIPLVLAMQYLPSWGYLAVMLLAAWLGIYICQFTAKAMGEHDHPAIVWDEIAGYMIAMYALPATWYNLLAAFVLFRWFDIRKPSVIGWCDRHLHGGLGIMADDLVAGLASAAVIHLSYLGWALVT
ncbi:MULTISPECIES: phosphatidylglycerophosphatase A [Pseudidiomarina]|uniref:Phosphatidylglycerophosphatase A n=3 Tax=Pseudidiomarina TaxID=2800384 RepID=A0A368UUP0_9GAMM|nr:MULTISPECIES: phosphatidylglycerophosphatase A [Pseudidiomarina]MDX1525510.1 phosphatidylglycerophosphatase A [Pseudidiomarina maritima]PWW13305.1 phosphatidylglycerophosphatase [Pseudidiomarina maritima]RBP90772.1 phosphatidylglycerophosphatase [Pseudidiomarina tainanensis]RCW32568.1 phosphatidylglycerophosphatase [Pseudidiomarina tainanensis]